MSYPIRLSILFAFFLSGSLVALGQQQLSGSYKMYIGEQPVSEEKFILTINSDGSRRSEAEIAAGPNKSKVITMATGNRPVSFSVESGNLKLLSAEFSAETAKIVTAVQPERSVKTGASVILENTVWHHFIYLFAQYDATRGGQQTFKAFLPSQYLEFGLQLERVGFQDFTVDGRTVKTESYRALSLNNLVFEVWTDEARVPLLIRIPSQKVKVIRGGAEALAAVVFPPSVKASAETSDSFSSEEVTVPNGDVRLAGTLTLPKKGKAPYPAAIIITGSGGQDRDGAIGVFNLYKLIAEQLSSAGIAALRLDDRGVGKSTAPQGRTTSYLDLVSDSRAAFDYLYQRSEIDRKKIAFIGHSEGSDTALIIAADDSRVAAIVLLAGSSRTIERIVLEQTLYQIALQDTIDPSDRSKMPSAALNILKLVEEAKSSPPPGSAGTDKYSYFREHAANNPLAIARRVRCPVLILNGERDTQVLPYHALELAQALTEGGNKEVRLRILPNLTHIFTPSPLDKSVTAEAATEISRDFLQTLQNWAVGALSPAQQAGARPGGQ
jgi:dienelactone hydrolase